RDGRLRVERVFGKIIARPEARDAAPGRVGLVLRLVQGQGGDVREQRGFLVRGDEFRAIDKAIRQGRAPREKIQCSGVLRGHGPCGSVRPSASRTPRSLTAMNGRIPRACVMGYPVKQSRSPLIHGYWLRQLGISGAYELKEIAPEAFPEFLTHLADHGYVGGNITVPHKLAAYQLVEHRDQAAEAIGAVNTVWLEGSRLMGGNSDAHGFIANLDDRAPGWDITGGHTVIIGAGGAARAA